VPKVSEYDVFVGGMFRCCFETLRLLLDEETDVVSLRDRAVAFLAFPPGEDRKSVV